MENIKKVLFYTLLFVNLYIWFDYFFGVAVCEKDCTNLIANISFYFVQIVMTAAFLELLVLLVKRQVTRKDLLASFMVSTVLLWSDFFIYMHKFMVAYNLYPGWLVWFEGEQIGTFQYARIVLLIFVIGTFYVSLLRKENRSFARVLYAWFFAALMVFIYTMHWVIGHQLQVKYQDILYKQMEQTLVLPIKEFKAHCVNLSYQCLVWDTNQRFDLSRPKGQNRAQAKKDSKQMIDQLINEKIIQPLSQAKIGEVILIEENGLGTNTIVRAVSAAGKKINEKEIVLLLDYDNTALSLSSYSILYAFLTILFLLVWGFGGYKIFLFHRHLNMK
jgi:hypothetical protein